MASHEDVDFSRRTFLTRTFVHVGGAALLGGGAMLGHPAPADAATDRNVRWCTRCQGLWFIAGGNNGHCPVDHWWDHSHYTSGSSTYSFIDVTSPAVGDDSFGQVLLRWCTTCKAVYFWQHESTSVWPDRVCPNNSAGHTPASSRYRIEMEQLPPISNFRKQSGWRRCMMCQVLFFIDNGQANTHCSANPVTGQHEPGSIFTSSGWEIERYFVRF